MSPKRKLSREKHHALMMRTDDGYRRLAERVEAGRTPAEREAFPLASKEFSREVTRQLQERLAFYEGKRRRASS